MRVLVVKMSSLGDIVHTLPAINDLAERYPQIELDWLVDEGFAQIPTWHPVVNQVFALPLRRWKKNLFKAQTWSEYRQFKQQLIDQKYDYVIDAQGLLKSVFFAKKVQGHTHGYDAKSIREPLASRFYDHTYSVSRQLHAVERIRTLFAQVFEYEVDLDKVHYRLHLEPLALSLAKKYIVFAHATTWEAKHFPENHWMSLADLLQHSGVTIYLPWVNEEEKARAQRIAQGRDWVELLPKVSLNQIAAVLQNASAVVGVDTGLSHIAASVETPVVAIYGATSAGLARPYGERVLALQSDYHCSPCMKKHCRYVEQGDAQTPPCYDVIDLVQIKRQLELY